MSKTDIQRVTTVLDYSGSMAAAAELSGSAFCGGYGRLIGIALSSASSVAGSGLSIYQSPNLGQKWAYTTTCQIAACKHLESAFSVEVVGDAIRIDYINGATTAASAWLFWQLRPV